MNNLPKSVLPKSVAQGVINIGGFKLRTHVLDNGQRVFEAKDFEKFITAFTNGDVDITPKDAEAYAKFMHGSEDI